MSEVLVPLLVGVFIGWLASLVWRTGTQLGIVLDLVAGAAGAVVASHLLGAGSTFDSLTAAGLGAFLSLVVLAALRRLVAALGPGAQAEGR